MQWYGAICIVKVFLLSEREISPNYTDIFLDFVHGFGSYVKGLPKTKRCNSVAVTVSVRIRCICETALTLSFKNIHAESCWIFFLNQLFQKKILYYHSVNSLDPDKPNVLSGLIWVQSVCKWVSKTSVDIVCKQCYNWSGSKLLDSLIVELFLKIFYVLLYEPAHEITMLIACADPDSLVRGGPKQTTLFLVDGMERGSKCHFWAIIGPPAKPHLKGVSMAGRWWLAW